MQEPHTRSYYAATAHAYPAFPVLQGETEADVVVIGGGFTGVNAAIELADRGLRVVLLEANRIGWGATGRNGGQITGSLSGDRAMAREFRRSLGSETENYIWNLRWRGHDIIRKRVARFGIDCDLKPGHLQAALKPAHVAELRALVAEAEARGMGDEVRYVEGADLRELLDVPIYIGGVHNRRNMHVHSLNLVIGEAQAAAGLGVRIFEDSEVIGITRGARPVVRTGQGRVTCDTVLLAGNAYHHLGRSRMRGVLFPAALGIIATAPIAEDVARAINPQDIAVYDDRFVLDYHRLSADRRLIFGGGTNYSGRDSADIAAELRPALERTYPRLKGIGIDFAWSGRDGIVLNRIPHLGRIAPNIFYAEGYSGHGIATTHIVAEIMAGAITGTMEEFDVFDAVHRLRLPIGNWLTHHALALGMAYYTLRERLT
ncbi:NAD(P)/FAD-dependent oxidoreductase [Paenirhodobacter populi]|uniref:FAD-binding oxidoreductase n=1 Tax=Paenirhodobacter populi TaxID=2306993 RepID=A0A443IYZ3_9RHOB|nr:FAD-binding oxidoreductase [Sinirhodobacter populi]RWR07679.1 FAD-binding oxidoreductase [Sinirhodobacter populi]RWR13411.1 FAD-binding oxidoreductase [Sinirhodobacter populi]RWR30746.1 FAD-binding oxidoreductase [Sinirhodobacter populi]